MNNPYENGNQHDQLGTEESNIKPGVVGNSFAQTLGGKESTSPSFSIEKDKIFPSKYKSDAKEKNANDGQELTLTQKIIREVKTIAVIILLVFVFRSIFFEPFKIPSGSMIPTLMIGDFILVNKLAYGLKVPFSDLFSDPVYISESKRPERGDVIVFKYPKDPSINYIKRVIGLPGDTVEMRDKVVYINGNPITPHAIEEPKAKKYMEDMDDKFKEMNLKFFNSKTGNHNHIYQINEDNFFKSDFEKVVIPKDNFFVMGDNRDFSADSRYWGPVPFENIKGKAVLVWFSMITPFSENNFKFRPWRIGTKIE
ncbi:MAG: signal peptidase I [Oligoflexia bacterium]|nr:signal peptidase I [Oligoflexia bacterium]